jgi:hypothetical protein
MKYFSLIVIFLIKFTCVFSQGIVPYLNSNGLYSLVKYNTEITINQESYENAEPIGDFLIKVNKGDLWGVIDSSGNLIVPTSYKSIRLIKNGYFIAYGEETYKKEDEGNYTKGFYSIFDTKGISFVKIETDDSNELILSDVYNNFLYQFFHKNNKREKMLCYDLKNRRIYNFENIKEEFDFDIPFDESYKMVVKYNSHPESKSLIDTTGNIIFTYFDIKRIDKGLYAVKKESNGKWGIIDENKNIISSFRYTTVNMFYDGLSLVTLEDGNGGFVNNYIDKSGAIVISNQSKIMSEDFSCGVYFRKSKDFYEIVNKVGVVVFKTPTLNFKLLSKINFNTIILQDYLNKKFRFIDINGKEKSEIKYSEITYLYPTHGYCILKAELENKNGIANYDGKTILNPVYDKIYCYKNCSRLYIHATKSYNNDKCSETSFPFDYYTFQEIENRNSHTEEEISSNPFLYTRIEALCLNSLFKVIKNGLTFYVDTNGREYKKD